MEGPGGGGPYDSVGRFEIPLGPLYSKLEQLLGQFETLQQKAGAAGATARPGDPGFIRNIEEQVTRGQQALQQLQSLTSELRTAREALDRERAALSRSQQAVEREIARGGGAVGGGGGGPLPSAVSGAVRGATGGHFTLLQGVRHQPQNPEMVEVARRFEHIIQGFETGMQKTLQGQAENAAKAALHDLLTKRQGNVPKEFRDILGPGKRPPELAAVSLEFLRRNLYQLLGVRGKEDFLRRIEQTNMAELRRMVNQAVEAVRSQFARTQEIGQARAPRYAEALAMRGMWSQQIEQGRNFPAVLSTSTKGAESELAAMLRRVGIDEHKLRMLASATGYDLGRGQKNPLSEAVARSALIQTAQRHYQQAGRADMAELERVLSMLPASGRHQLIGRLKEAIVPTTRNAATGQWEPQRVLGRFGMLGGRPSPFPTEPDIVLPLALFGNDPNKIKGYLQSIMQVQGTSHSIDTIMRQYSQITGTDMGALIKWVGQTGAEQPAKLWPTGPGGRLRLDSAQRQALGKAIADLITQHGGLTGRSRTVSGARLGNIMRSLAMAGAPLYGSTPLEFLSGGQRASTGRAAIGQAIAGMGAELGTLVEAIQQGTLPIMTYAGGTFPIQQLEEILKLMRPGVQTTPASFAKPIASLVSHGIRGFRQFHRGAGVDWFRALAKGSGIGRHVSESGSLMSVPEDIWRFYEALPGSEEAIALSAAAHSGGGTAFAKDFIESLKRITRTTGESGGFEYDAAKVQEIQRAAEAFQTRVSRAFQSGDVQRAMTEARTAMGAFSKTMTETFGKKWGGGARGGYLNQALRLTAQRMGIPVGQGGLGGAVLTPLGGRFATPSALGQLSAMMMTQASGGGALGELRGLGHAALAGEDFHKVYATLDPEYQALFGRRDVASHQAFAMAQLRKYAKEPYQGGVSYLEAIYRAQQTGEDIAPIVRSFESQFGSRSFFGVGPEEFPTAGLSGKRLAAMRGVAFGGRPTGRGKAMEARTLSYVLGGNLESYLSALGPSFATESRARQWLSERSGMPLGEVTGSGEFMALMRAYGAESPQQFIPFKRFVDVMARSTTGWFRSGQGQEALRRFSEGLHGARGGELPPFVLDEAGVRDWARRAGAESPERIAALFSELMPPGGAPYEMLRYLPPEVAGAGYGQVGRMTGEVPGGAVPGGAAPPGGALPAGTEPLLAALRSLTEALNQHLAATNKLSALIETGAASGAGAPRVPGGPRPPSQPPQQPPQQPPGAPPSQPSGPSGGGGWGRYIAVSDVNAFQRDLQTQFDQIAQEAFGGPLQSARKSLAAEYGYGRFGPGVRIGTEQGYIGTEWRPDQSGVLQRTVRGDVGARNIAQAREHAQMLTEQFYEQIRQSITQARPGLSESEIRRLTMQDPRYRSMGYMGQRIAAGRIGEGAGAMGVDYVETGGGVVPVLRGHKAGLMTISETAKAGALKLEESARLREVRRAALQQVREEAAAQGRAPTYREGRRAADLASMRLIGEEAGLVNILGATGTTERQVMRWRLGTGGRPRLAAETPGPIVYSSMREVAQEATRMTAALDKLVAAEKAAATSTEEKANIERRYIGERGRGTMRVAGHDVPVQFTRLAGGQVIGVPQTGGTLTATAGPGAAQEIGQLLRQQALVMDRELRAVAQMPGMEGMRATGRKYGTQDVQWVTPTGVPLTRQRFNMVETPWGVRPEAEATRLGFTRVGGDVQGAIEKVGLWAVATGAVYNYIHAMRNAVSLMTEFEAELAASRVLQPPYADIDRSRRAFVDIAKEYGQSVTIVAQAAHLWERQYKDVYQVLELTRQSIKLSKVDNLDLAQANKYLEATINEMGFAAEDASRIVDSWTSVTNNAQVSMEDLTEGVARAGGAARLAGVSFDELNGMVAAGVRATGAAGHEVGNMLKTVFGKMYTEQAVRQLNQLGIATHQIVGGVKELRPAKDVLQDLAGQWHNLTRAQGEAVALAMAGGVRQYARLAALLNDYSTALETARDSQDSFNAANREVSIRLDTLQGQLSRLKAEIQGIATSAMFEGGGLGMARGAVGFAQGLTGFVGNLPAGSQATLGGAGTILANLMAMNFLFRIFGNKGFLEWNQIKSLGIAGATWPQGGAPATAARGIGGIGRGLWSSIRGGAIAGYARAPETFGFGTATAPSLVGAGEAAAVGTAGQALGGLAGIAAGLGRNLGRLAAIVGVVVAALMALSWAGKQWSRHKMSPEERAWRDAQDEIIRRAPLYESASRIEQLRVMKEEGRFGVAQYIEMADVNRTLRKQEEKLGLAAGTTPQLEAERSRRALLGRSLDYFARSVRAIERDEEAPPDLYERMSQFLNYVPQGAEGMTPWMMTELMGQFGQFGLGGARKTDTKAAFMNTALGISLRRSLDAMGIPTENVAPGGTLVDYLDAIKTTEKVITGRGPAMAAWGQAAREGALGWMFTSREGQRGAPSGYLISQAYDQAGRLRYHVTGGGGPEGEIADRWFDTIEQAQNFVGTTGDSFMALVDTVNAGIPTLDNLWKSLDAIEKELKTMARVSGELSRILGSIPGMFQFAGATVGSGAAGRTATGLFTRPMAGMFGVAAYARGQSEYLRAMEADYQRKLTEGVVALQAEMPGMSREEIIALAREQAATGEKQTGFEPSHIKGQLAEIADTYDRITDLRRQYLEQERQAVDSLRRAQQAIMSMQDESLELRNVWRDLASAIGDSRDAAWLLYDLQKRMASEQLAGATMEYFGIGGGYEGQVARERQMQQQFGQVVGRLAEATVGGQTAVARAGGAALPYGIQLPGFAQGWNPAAMNEQQIWRAQQLSERGGFGADPSSVLNLAAETFARAVEVFARAIGSPEATRGAVTTGGRLVVGGGYQGGSAERIAGYAAGKARDPFLAWLHQGEYVLPANMAASMGPALERARRSGSVGQALDLRGVASYQSGGYAMMPRIGIVPMDYYTTEGHGSMHPWSQLQTGSTFAHIADASAKFGVPITATGTYISIGNEASARQTINALPAWLATLKSRGIVPMIGLEPQQTVGGTRSVYDQITPDNPLLRDLARALESYGGEAHIRFASEMNLSNVYAGQPGAYKQAFRTLSGILPPNAMMSFSPGLAKGPYKQYWPGADVVDVVGGTFYGHKGRTDELQALSDYWEWGSQFGKPFGLEELSFEEGADREAKAVWGQIAKTADFRYAYLFDYTKGRRAGWRAQAPPAGTYARAAAHVSAPVVVPRAGAHVSASVTVPRAEERGPGWGAYAGVGGAAAGAGAAAYGIMRLLRGRGGTPAPAAMGAPDWARIGEGVRGATSVDAVATYATPRTAADLARMAPSELTEAGAQLEWSLVRYGGDETHPMVLASRRRFAAAVGRGMPEGGIGMFSPGSRAEGGVAARLALPPARAGAPGGAIPRFAMTPEPLALPPHVARLSAAERAAARYAGQGSRVLRPATPMPAGGEVLRASAIGYGPPRVGGRFLEDIIGPAPDEFQAWLSARGARLPRPSWLPTRGQQVRPYQEQWGTSAVEMEAQVERQLAEAAASRADTLQRLRQRSALGRLQRWQQRYPPAPTGGAIPRFGAPEPLALPAPVTGWASPRQLWLPGMAAGYEGPEAAAAAAAAAGQPVAVPRGGGARQLTLPFDQPARRPSLTQEMLDSERMAALRQRPTPSGGSRYVSADEWARAMAPPRPTRGGPRGEGGALRPGWQWPSWLRWRRGERGGRGPIRGGTRAAEGRPWWRIQLGSEEPTAIRFPGQAGQPTMGGGAGRPPTAAEAEAMWAAEAEAVEGGAGGISREAAAARASRAAAAARESAVTGRGPTATGPSTELPSPVRPAAQAAGEITWRTRSMGAGVGAALAIPFFLSDLERQQREGTLTWKSAAKSFGWTVGAGAVAGGVLPKLMPLVGPRIGGAARVLGPVGGAAAGFAMQYFNPEVAERERVFREEYGAGRWRRRAMHAYEAFAESLGAAQALRLAGMRSETKTFLGRSHRDWSTILGAALTAGGLTAAGFWAPSVLKTVGPMAGGAVAGRLVRAWNMPEPGDQMQLGTAVEQKPIGDADVDRAIQNLRGTYTRPAAMRDYTRNLARAMIASQRAMSEEVAKNLGTALTEFRREAPRYAAGMVHRTLLRSLGTTDFSGLGPTGAADRRYMWWGMSDMPATGLGPMARMGFTEAAISRMGLAPYIGMGGGRLAQEQSQTAQTAFRRSMDESFKQFGEWASNTLNPQVRQLGQAMLDAALNLNKFGTGEWAALIDRVPRHLRGAVQHWAAVRVAEAQRLRHMAEAAEVLGTHQRVAEQVTALVGGVGPTGRYQVGEVAASQWANIMLGRMAPGQAQTPFAMQQQAAQQSRQMALSGLQALYSQYGRGNAAAGGAIQAVQAATSGNMAAYRQIMGGLPAESRTAVQGILRAGQMANWQPPRRGEVEEKVLSAAYGVGDEWMQYLMGPERYSFMMGGGVDMSPVFMGAGGRQTAMPMSYLSQWAPSTAAMWSGYQGWYQTSGFWGGQAGMSEMIRQPLSAAGGSNLQSMSGMVQFLVQALGQIAHQDAQTSQMNLEAAKMFVSVVNRDGQQRTIMTDDFRAASRFGGQITGFDAQGRRIAGPTSVDPSEAQM